MFIITERQYNIIMQQAQSCYPQESGGVLGGKDNTILGVLPIINKHLYNRTEAFALSNEDIDTAHEFLNKHKLDYMGVYHSHPSGSPYPSDQDLSHNQKYLFIVGLKDRYNPELYAWRVEGREIIAEDIKIISDVGITVIDIKTGKPKLSENATHAEMDRLANMINAFIGGFSPKYSKIAPSKWDASSFSTFA
ncbi:MAG: M67 family metallopeptidase [Candidatus Margulisiibacteriota bacterium]